jgi:hypothetical protein
LLQIPVSAGIVLQAERNIREREHVAINELLSFLRFDDWFARNDRTAKDWITVASHQTDASPDKDTNLFTFSALVSQSDEPIHKLLSKPDWEIEKDFALPEFYATSDNPNPRYDPRTEVMVDGVEFRPFVFWRYFHDYVPTTFELIQGFILYHEAFWHGEGKEYRRLDDAGDLHIVARLVQSDDANIEWQVDAHHLKDYLAATACYLVRYHAHMRWVREDITATIGGKSKAIPLKGQMARFELRLQTDTLRQNYKSVAWLRGKDIIEPYARPDERHTGVLTGFQSHNPVKFIIGRGTDGQDIVSASDEGEFLTPVFFTRQVLDKYYAEPKKFRVTEWSQVACLDLWGLPIDHTEEDLIQVWLGDLGSIPYKEQLHWRQFNVMPRGGITSRRFRQDFGAEFVDVTGQPVHDFKSAFEHAQMASQEKYGTPVFLPLSEQDKGMYEALHVPTNDEPKAFDDQILALAKATVDSLNVDLLERLSGARIDNNRIRGSLGLLEEWLRHFLGVEKSSVVIEPLRTLQAIRSASAAHRKGSKLEPILKKAGLAGLANHTKFEKLLMEARAALDALRAAFDTAV